METCLTLGEQIRLVRKSDVLCGVHGAALVHTLFLRAGSELIEFRPRRYQRNDIFKNLARFGSVKYRGFFARTKQRISGGKLVVELTRNRCA